MYLVQGFRPATWETQGDGSNEFLVTHRLRDFCGINTEVIFFQSINCLLVFIFT